MPILVTGPSLLKPECDYGTIREQTQATEALTGTAVDVDEQVRECLRLVRKLAEEAQQLALAEQVHNRMVLAGVVAAGLALTALVYFFRKPIRAFLEAAFIGVVAKAISGRRDFKGYRENIARRIREKSGE